LSGKKVTIVAALDLKPLETLRNSVEVALPK
jgi:hypothetical protein